MIRISTIISHAADIKDFDERLSKGIFSNFLLEASNRLNALVKEKSVEILDDIIEFMKLGHPRRRHSTLGWESSCRIGLTEHLGRHESGAGPNPPVTKLRRFCHR